MAELPDFFVSGLLKIEDVTSVFLFVVYVFALVLAEYLAVGLLLAAVVDDGVTVLCRSVRVLLLRLFFRLCIAEAVLAAHLPSGLAQHLIEPIADDDNHGDKTKKTQCKEGKDKSHDHNQ